MAKDLWCSSYSLAAINTDMNVKASAYNIIRLSLSYHDTVSLSVTGLVQVSALQRQFLPHQTCPLVGSQRKLAAHKLLLLVA